MRNLSHRFPSLAIAALSLFLLGLPMVAAAGNFSVSPVRIFMKPADRASAITIVNHGDKDLTLETELTIWKQNQDGSFDQQLTDDVIVAPPLLRLAPKARQVIRIARVISATPGSQMTYRILVREILGASAPKPGYNVDIALAFSIPIFITPVGFKHDVSCKLGPKRPEAMDLAQANTKPDDPQSVAIVRCDNAGSAHSLITSVKLFDLAKEVASSKQVGYTLVNSGNNFPIFRTNEAQPLPQGSLRMVISHDDNTQQTVNVTLPQ